MEKLGINWPLFIAQLINVALLVWLLSTFLLKPIINMLNERTKRIQEGLGDSDKIKDQLASVKRDYDAEIAKARQEAAGIVSLAQERARAQEQEIVAQARVEAERIKGDAREQAIREREQMVSDLKDQIAGLVTTTATKVLGAELKMNHDRLIDESLASLGRQN
jgi:F-type H+-transporting ATPase subunit b